MYTKVITIKLSQMGRPFLGTIFFQSKISWQLEFLKTLSSVTSLNFEGFPPPRLLDEGGKSSLV